MAHTAMFASVVGVWVLAFSLAAPASALHCNGTILTVPAGVTYLYVDDRSDGPGNINHWFYLESNAVHGLQSGGSIETTEYCWEPKPCFFDPCWHPNPDQLII